jgi:hypothetical protein
VLARAGLLSRSLPRAPQIAGNLKKYSKRYDEVDASLAAEADTALVAERAALMDDWLAWLRAKRQAMDTEEYRAALVSLVCACDMHASVRLCVLTDSRAIAPSVLLQVGPPKSAEAEAYSNETIEVEELISHNEETLF